MDIARDLQDKKVVDRNGRVIGRVDRVVLAMEAGRPPRVVGIELGLAVLGRRLGRFIGGLSEGLERALGIEAGRPYRIPMTQILSVNDSVKVDVAVGETPAAALEQKLRRLMASLVRGFSAARHQRT